MRTGLYRIPPKCQSPVKIFFLVDRSGGAINGEDAPERGKTCFSFYGFDHDGSIAYVHKPRVFASESDFQTVNPEPFPVSGMNESEREYARRLLIRVLDMEKSMIVCVIAQKILQELGSSDNK